MFRPAGRYDDPRALDCGTGTAAVRDRKPNNAARVMWSQDPNASPINWLLLRHQGPSASSASEIRRPQRCYLLEIVPVEIREMILRYCLPSTIAYNGGTAWCKGSMAVLRVCRKLYDEGTAILYRENVFSLDVIYDCAYFAMTWLTPTHQPGRFLHVRRQRAFPECLAVRNVAKLRRFEITIRHVDSYTGMIKYGYGGGGLTDGLRTQVVFLCQTLRNLPVIDALEISYQCQDVRQKAETQNVLNPFLLLRNVRSVSTSGHVLDEMSFRLVSQLPEARRRRLEEHQDTCKDIEEAKEILSQPVVLPFRKALAYYRGYDSRDI